MQMNEQRIEALRLASGASDPDPESTVKRAETYFSFLSAGSETPLAPAPVEAPDANEALRGLDDILQGTVATATDRFRTILQGARYRILADRDRSDT